MISTNKHVFFWNGIYSQWHKARGIGMSEQDPGVDDPANWKGLNLLGWSITLVKQQIKNS